MLTYRLNKVLILTLALFSYSAMGKGLEKLTPEVKPENTKETATDASVKETDPTKKGKPEEKQEAVKVEPTELSKSLVDRLFLSSSIGFVKLTKSGGEWSGSNAADFAIGYMFDHEKIIPKAKLFATYRYVPMDVVIKANGHSYRGVLQTQNFGVMGVLKYKEGISAIGLAELGYATAQANPVDDSQKDKDLEKGGLNLTLGGGADWSFWEKFKVGPRVYIGFGTFQSIQLNANLSLYF